MDRTPDNGNSNPISRAFSKFFERGKVGKKADAPARTTPGVQRTAPRTQTAATPAPPQRASTTTSPLVGAAAGTARPVVATPQTATPPGASQAQGAATPAAAAAPRTYTVQSGDSLSKISQRIYGRADRWTLIFEANRDTISDPDRIFPGQVLVLPDVQSLH